MRSAPRLREVGGGFVREDVYGEVGRPVLDDVRAELEQLDAEHRQTLELVDALRGEVQRLAWLVLKVADDTHVLELDCSDEVLGYAEQIRTGNSAARDEARALEEALAAVHGRAA